MTQSLETLTRRTDSMQGIRSIVHTMKTLSVINAAPYEHAAEAIEAYHATILDGLHALLHQSGPLDAEAAAATPVLIVFGSDHGLCGSYNQALAAHVAGQPGNAAAKTTVLCVGAQMADALRDEGLEPRHIFFPPASVDGIGRLANLLTRHLDTLRLDPGGRRDIVVSVACFARDRAKGQRPEVTALLPPDPKLVRDLQARPWVSRSLPSFSMPPGDLLRALIRAHLFAGLFRAAAEALVTENAARLAQMQQAEQSIDDRLEALTAETRSVRQSEITTELLDVIIGFEALKKSRRPTPDRAGADGAEAHSRPGLLPE
tara:strand:+ start:5591 stop:6541 length:951 start_codon:yes stop_codon:yes gene_type:complete